jgi:hypothetical protein
MNAVLPIVAIRAAVVPTLLVLTLACAHQADDCQKMLTCGYFPEPDAGQGGVSGQGGSKGSGTGGASTTAAGGAGIAGGATGGATGVGGAPTSTGGNSSTGGASSSDTFAGGSISAGGTVGTGGITMGTGGNGNVGGIGTGGLATGGAGTGGFVSACNPTCTTTKPICNESAATCVECLENGNCPASRPACNLATHTCVGCMLDNYCSAPTPACNLATYTCVGCLSSANCSSPAAACNTTTNLCVQCTKDTNCSGSTPACNIATNLCVQCTGNGNCGGLTPLCDTAKNTCVECLSSADCKSPAASLCNGGTCIPCAANADCSHLSGTTVCKTGSASESDAGAEPGDAGTSPNECVQCTGTDYAACGQSGGKNLVCNSLTNTCSTSAEHSAGLCKTCVSDAQCTLGEMCVEEMFNGQSAGYFCFYKQGDSANGAPASCISNGRPYSGVLKNAVSIDGKTADICSLVTSTCTALNEYRAKDCTSGATANDQTCGFAPGVDSKCASTSTAGVFLCTTTCLSDLDCKIGVACNTGVNPNVCSFP